MKLNRLLFFAVLGVSFLQSCGVNSNLMMKTPKDWEKYADETTLIDTNNKTKDQYIIDVNDIIQLQFFTNDGIKILDLSTTAQQGQAQVLNVANQFKYVIQKDSTVKLPVIDEVNIVGKSIREAEEYLEELYSVYYMDPFVQLNVTNRRVIVFPGSGGEAQVLYLQNNNTTLMEAIALAGGITERGRASKIKLMRKTSEGHREVYKIDLSKIEHLAYADVVVRANDYIYVEPVPEIGKELLKEIAPIVSLITSAAVIISVVTALSN